MDRKQLKQKSRSTTSAPTTPKAKKRTPAKPVEKPAQKKREKPVQPLETPREDNVEGDKKE